MSSEESNKRRERETAESRRRTINYIVVAVLAALIVTVLFLVFGRSDKNSNNGQSPTGTTTEQVTTPSGTNGTATNPSGSVNRPPAKVDRPATGNTIYRPTSSDSKPTYEGRTDVPHTEKGEILKQIEAEKAKEKENSNNKPSRNAAHRR